MLILFGNLFVSQVEFEYFFVKMVISFVIMYLLIK